jgi:eukaryotic-like serine/threonine-protein kinase
MSLTPGDVVDGKYQIVRLLGEGGMGAVYEGLNVRIHRRVAIKVLHGTVAHNAEAVERFEREAQAAGRIGSSHIVEVLDLGDLPGGDRYMVMEFLDGQSLADRVKAQGKLSAAEIYPIAVQLLEGLAAAHAAGIVHRDLKPDNVYLINSKRDGQRDFVKILDFGISKFNALGGEFSMTRTGAVMGTPYYMSPEQAKGARELDQRTDLYAVGVILYECSSGRVPFQAHTFNELLFKIVLEEPPPLQELQTNLDDGFIALVSKAMARDVSQRYQTASEFQQALHNWAQGAGLGDGGLSRHTLPLGAARPAPPAAGPPAAPTAVTSPTAPGWSATPTQGTESLAQAKGKRTPLILGGLVASAVLLGGGIWAFGGGALSNDAETDLASQAEEERLSAERSEKERQASLDEKATAERAREAAEKAQAEPQPAEPALPAAPAEPVAEPAAEPAQPSAGLAASSAAPSQVVSPKKTPTTTSVTSAKSTPTPTKSPTTTPTAQPAPTKPSGQTDRATTSTGRTIRSTL